MNDSPPYSSPYDLEKLPEKGLELVLEPAAAERDRIAAWLGIEALDHLKVVVRVTRGGSGRFSYRGHFEADVVQACVVTLEPVPSHIEEDIDRSFQLAPAVAHPARRSRKPAIPPVVAIGDLEAEGPDLLESPVVDLAAPVLEELSLSLDPYPRKAGVAFTQPEEAPAGPADNPFAVLGKLKGS
jgi:uncharacterized metal-binding protein YceD (DUF177 family)